MDFLILTTVLTSIINLKKGLCHTLLELSMPDIFHGTTKAKCTSFKVFNRLSYFNISF